MTKTSILRITSRFNISVPLFVIAANASTIVREPDTDRHGWPYYLAVVVVVMITNSSITSKKKNTPPNDSDLFWGIGHRWLPRTSAIRVNDERNRNTANVSFRYIVGESFAKFGRFRVKCRRFDQPSTITKRPTSYVYYGRRHFADATLSGLARTTTRPRLGTTRETRNASGHNLRTPVVRP